MALAIATREMSDWLATNFYNITMPINHRVRIGQEIKALRIAAALSQDKLGEMAGVSQGNVARIETGRYSATIDTLQAVVAGLHDSDCFGNCSDSGHYAGRIDQRSISDRMPDVQQVVCVGNSYFSDRNKSVVDVVDSSDSDDGGGDFASPQLSRTSVENCLKNRKMPQMLVILNGAMRIDGIDVAKSLLITLHFSRVLLFQKKRDSSLSSLGRYAQGFQI